MARKRQQEPLALDFKKKTTPPRERAYPLNFLTHNPRERQNLDKKQGRNKIQCRIRRENSPQHNGAESKEKERFDF